MMAFPLECWCLTMMKNLELLLSPLISLKPKIQDKTAKHFRGGEKAAGKISKAIPIAQDNASCSAWLTTWLSHYHLFLVFSPHQPIIYQMKQSSLRIK